MVEWPLPSHARDAQVTTYLTPSAASKTVAGPQVPRAPAPARLDAVNNGERKYEVLSMQLYRRN